MLALAADDLFAPSDLPRASVTNYQTAGAMAADDRRMTLHVDSECEKPASLAVNDLSQAARRS